MDNLLSHDIIEEWGLAAMPAEKQAEMAERIGRLMYQAILVRALDILSEKEQTEFDLILDEDDTTPQDVIAFLQSKIPTLSQMLIEERQKLKEDILVPVA